MKKSLCVLVVMLLGFSAAHGGSLGVMGQYLTEPSFDNDFAWFAIGMRYELPLTDTVSGDVRLSYAVDIDSDDDYTAIPLEAGLVLKFPMQSINPYVGAGVGYYMYQIDSAVFDDPAEVGFYALAGLQFELSPRSRLFLEAKYTKADYEDSESTSFYIPGVLYMRRTTYIEGGFDGLGGNIGIMWDL